jgi:DNA-directed RNA polymerase specialized sigma24 family protein
VPFHWNCADWREEVVAEGQSAAWQALGEYDASRGVPFGAFVFLRVTASVLTRYRQEWAYGARHVAIDEDREREDSETFGRTSDHEALHRALARLPESDRQLLVELF